MEWVAFDCDCAHLRLADLDALFVGTIVEDALHREARLGFRCTDQLDDSQSAFEWPTPPVLRNMAEHAMLDLVPLRGAGWIVIDVERQAGLVCELLQFHFPETHAR